MEHQFTIENYFGILDWADSPQDALDKYNNFGTDMDIWGEVLDDDFNHLLTLTIDELKEYAKDNSQLIKAIRLNQVALEWLNNEHGEQECGTHPDTFLEALRNDFRHNKDHLADCFNNTSDWAKGEPFTQSELEQRVIELVMQDQSW